MDAQMVMILVLVAMVLILVSFILGLVVGKKI